MAAPTPVEDAQVWDEAGHDAGRYVALLRERGALTPWVPAFADPLLSPYVVWPSPEAVLVGVLA